MKNIALSFILSSTILLCAQPIQTLSKVQTNNNEVAENTDDSYISLDKKKSKLVEVVSQISEWDQEQNSPLHLLQEYIQEGGTISLKNAVLDALESAEEIITTQSNNRSVPQDILDAIGGDLNSIIDAVINGTLAIDANASSRACCPDEDPAQIIKVREKLYVLERAKFFNDVEMKKRVVIEGKLRVHNSVKVDDLSVVDNLTVGANFFLSDSTDECTGNIIKNGIVFIHNHGTDNTFVGDNAGNFAMTGIGNNGFGVDALSNNISGSENTAIGNFTLTANTIGSYNTAVGDFALANNTTGYLNTAVGTYALESNTTGYLNTASGTYSLTTNTEGIANTADGFGALGNNTTGSSSTASGFLSLTNNTTGSNNTAFGSVAMANNITGSNNTAIGVGAIANAYTGNNNIALGYGAGSGLAAGESNDIYIGNSGVAAESNTIRIGTTGTHNSCYIAGISGASVIGGTAVSILPSGQLGTVVSSSRFKHDITDMDDESAKIYDLHPVTFAYNQDPSETTQYGLIAEEVNRVFPALVVTDEDGEPYTVHYEMLPVLLLNEIQKLAARVTALEERA